MAASTFGEAGGNSSTCSKWSCRRRIAALIPETVPLMCRSHAHSISRSPPGEPLIGRTRFFLVALPGELRGQPLEPFRPGGLGLLLADRLHPARELPPHDDRKAAGQLPNHGERRHLAEHQQRDGFV